MLTRQKLKNMPNTRSRKLTIKEEHSKTDLNRENFKHKKIMEI